MISTLLLLLSPKDCIEAWPFLSTPLNRATISRNFYKFELFESVQDRAGRGRKRTSRSEENVEEILNIISTDMFASISYISRLTKISKTSVSRVLNENEMTSYKVGQVQELMKLDYEKRIKFCRWYLRWIKKQDRVVWWSEECSFSIVAQLNTQNRRYRSKSFFSGLLMRVEIVMSMSKYG